MSKVFIDDTNLTAIANAIRSKTGSSDTYYPSQMAAAIKSIETGGDGSASASLDSVNFYDYDGSVVASYTLEEAQALTSLPDGPKHDGLVFQGWNWSLSDINALNRPMNVGATYITDDGKTRLVIRVYDIARSTVPIRFTQSVSNGVTIDWGDGSSTETLTETGIVTTTHKYSSIGEYTISLSVSDGCILCIGNTGDAYCVMGNASTSKPMYSNALTNVYLGANIYAIGLYAFNNCYSLSSITIPSSVTSINGYAFNNCYSLSSITIPSSVTSISSNTFLSCITLFNIVMSDNVTDINSYAFNSCYSLATIIIPNGVSTISPYLLNFCRSLSSLTIPNSVTTIESNAFQYCSTISEYHILSTTPPTLSSTSAFTGIASDCIIYVPQGCLEAYQTATNWTAYANHMMEEPT